MMVKDWRKDALIYAELGMGFYIVSFVILSVGFVGFPLFFLRGDEFIRMMMIMIGIVCSSPPLLLAWLTYDKMVKVLRQNRDPQLDGQKHWNG